MLVTPFLELIIIPHLRFESTHIETASRNVTIMQSIRSLPNTPLYSPARSIEYDSSNRPGNNANPYKNLNLRRFSLRQTVYFQNLTVFFRCQLLLQEQQRRCQGRLPTRRIAPLDVASHLHLPPPTPQQARYSRNQPHFLKLPWSPYLESLRRIHSVSRALAAFGNPMIKKPLGRATYSHGPGGQRDLSIASERLSHLTWAPFLEIIGRSSLLL